YYESTDGEKTLLFFDGDKWQTKIPDDAEYILFDESLKRIGKNGHTPQILKLTGKWTDLWGSNGVINNSFLVVTDRLIGHTQENDSYVVLKYKKDGSGASSGEGYCKIEVPGFKKIYVDSNYSGYNDEFRSYKGDVIVAEGEITSGNKVVKKKYIYSPTLTEIGSNIKINGRKALDEDYEMMMIGEGTYNDRSGKWEIKKVENELGDL
ncbi:MAG: hypothetical protein K2H18_01195, partial [Muribaculaceae bacterium]|nr:hypothetical protein [Muribaculaceae bacterium]